MHPMESERCIASPSTVKLRRTLQTRYIFWSLVLTLTSQELQRSLPTPFVSHITAGHAAVHHPSHAGRRGKHATCVVLWRHPVRRSSPRTHTILTAATGDKHKTAKQACLCGLSTARRPTSLGLSLTSFQTIRLHQLLNRVSPTDLH